jgi:hypothetical protein
MDAPEGFHPTLVLVLDLAGTFTSIADLTAAELDQPVSDRSGTTIVVACGVLSAALPT